jgi:N6-L-threonylcarbamoyladenine synthase
MSLILGIETSCDETSIAIVENGSRVLSNVVATQIARHAVFGGVVPELAAREHLVALQPVLKAALSEAKVELHDLSAIAVTNGPGLMPALLVGLNYAKGLAAANRLPLIPVNHFLAHIYAACLDHDPAVLKQSETYPILALVVSGGHSSLLLINEHGEARQIGCTIDDAAGEALDKAAKLLNLGYPGGPIMQKTAADGNPEAFHFPRPLTGTAGKAVPPEHKYNFSFSGVKTALLYHVKNHDGAPAGAFLHDTAASYQEAIIDVLTRKTVAAAREFSARTIILCGGVACNQPLRDRLRRLCPPGAALRIAPPKYCTDNAAMVAGLGWHYLSTGRQALEVDAFARLPVITRVPFGKGG